jgi:RND family efflux transporter MFP subunit
MFTHGLEIQMRVQSLYPTRVALLVAALSACSTARSEEALSEPDAPVPIRVQPAVTTARPRTTAASGAVQAQTTVDVAFQVPGKVVAVGPDEGDVVAAGELLARIDPTDYQLALEQSAAQAEHAAQERQRHRPLLDVGSIAPSDYERIETAARQGAAAAGLARKRLGDTRLVAPIAGVVARRAIDRGETATPGQAVFTIMDVDPVKVRIGVPEADIAMVRVGQPATVRLTALGDETFSGRVTLVGVAADPTTRTYAVEVAVPNPERRLKVGMVAEAQVQGDRQVPAISVPAGAVVRDADGATLVYVLDARSERVHARRVAVGAARADEVEIASGLGGGEPVVVAGQHRVREGSRVVLSPATASAAGGAQ